MKLNKKMSVHNIDPLWTLILVPVTGLEPVRSQWPRDFKSLVSAYSTTPANMGIPFGMPFLLGDPDENRTRVTAVKGRCLNRLTTGPLVAEIGLEPTTLRVWTECSSQLSYSAVFFWKDKFSKFDYSIFSGFCQAFSQSFLRCRRFCSVFFFP